MGQKINPIIFRLGKYNKEWNSYYIEKNFEESSLLLLNDLKIREYLSRLLKLNGLILHSCKIRFAEEAVSVSVYYFRLHDNRFLMNGTMDLYKLTSSLYYFLNNKNCCKGLKIFIKFRDVNKYAKKLVDLKMNYINKIFRRHLKDALFIELLKVSVVSLLIHDSSRLLVEFLIIKLKFIKTQNKVIFYLKLILTELVKKEIFKINGLKLIIKGRLNKSPRSRKKEIVLGSIPLQTIRTKIDYCQSTAFTSVGTFGLKLWICRKLS
jgi:hypothetical protein